MNLSEEVNQERLNLFEVQPGDAGITYIDGILLYTEIPGIELALKSAGVEITDKELSFCG